MHALALSYIPGQLGNKSVMQNDTREVREERERGRWYVREIGAREGGSRKTKEGGREARE